MVEAVAMIDWMGVRLRSPWDVVLHPEVAKFGATECHGQAGLVAVMMPHSFLVARAFLGQWSHRGQGGYLKVEKVHVSPWNGDAIVVAVVAQQLIVTVLLLPSPQTQAFVAVP